MKHRYMLCDSLWNFCASVVNTRERNFTTKAQRNAQVAQRIPPGVERRARWIALLPASRVFLAAIAMVFAVGCTKPSPTPTNTPSRAASSPTPLNVTSSADVVKVASTSIAVPVGGTAEATVMLSITPHYHVNANPPTFSYLIPTELTPQKLEGITTGKPTYPASEKKKFQFAEEPVAVYEGQAPIKLSLHAAPNATKSMRPLPLTVRVQACDNEKCYPPATLKSYISVEIK